MADTLRVGLIGAGNIAGAHVGAFAAVDDCEIVAVWNRTRARADKLVTDRGLRNATVFDDWEAMLDEAALDIVDVISAPQLRQGPVLMALDRGMHVLVEKPFAVNLAEAGRMVAAADGSDRVTAVCFTWRYKPSALLARRLFQSRQIGALKHFSSVWRMSMPAGWLTPEARPFINEAQQGLGMFGENGSHQFDMLRFLTGECMAELAGKLDWIEPENPALRANYAHRLIGASASGASVTVEHTMPPGPFWRASQRRVYIEGDRGHLRIDGGLLDDGAVWLFLDGDPEARRVDPEPEDLAVPTGHVGLVSDFVSCIRQPGGKSARPDRLGTFEDGLQSLRAVLAGHMADREKRWVSLSEL